MIPQIDKFILQHKAKSAPLLVASCRYGAYYLAFVDAASDICDTILHWSMLPRIWAILSCDRWCCLRYGLYHLALVDAASDMGYTVLRSLMQPRIWDIPSCVGRYSFGYRRYKLAPVDASSDVGNISWRKVILRTRKYYV